MFLCPCPSIKMYYSFFWLCCITLCFNFIYQYYPLSMLYQSEHALYIIPSLFLYSVSKMCSLIYNVVFNKFFKSHFQQLVTVSNSNKPLPNTFVLIALLTLLSLCDMLFSVAKYDSRLRVLNSYNYSVYLEFGIKSNSILIVSLLSLFLKQHKLFQHHILSLVIIALCGVGTVLINIFAEDLLDTDYTPIVIGCCVSSIMFACKEVIEIILIKNYNVKLVMLFVYEAVFGFVVFAVYCGLVTIVKGYNEVLAFLKDCTNESNVYLMITFVIVVAGIVEMLYVIVNKHLTFKYAHLSEVISYFSYLIISIQEGIFEMFLANKAAYVLICFGILGGMLIYAEIIVIPCFGLNKNIQKKEEKEMEVLLDEPMEIQPPEFKSEDIE